MMAKLLFAVLLLLFAIEVSADCPQLEQFPHGTVECSNGVNVTTNGTVCEFNCTETGYQVHPAANNLITCLESGHWDKPQPCCALPCPPYVQFDVISIAHAENNETLNKIAEVRRSGFRNVIFSPDNGTMYAKLEFSGDVHESRRYTFNEIYNGNFDPTLPYINTDDGLVNIGKALSWAYDNMLGEDKGERPLVRDLLMVGTDSESTDNVTDAVQAWLDRGALIYALVFPNLDGVFPRHEKMLEIARESDHVIYYDGDSETAAEKLFGEAFEHLCESACDHVLHDHDHDDDDDDDDDHDDDDHDDDDDDDDHDDDDHDDDD